MDTTTKREAAKTLAEIVWNERETKADRLKAAFALARQLVKQIEDLTGS